MAICTVFNESYQYLNDQQKLAHLNTIESASVQKGVQAHVKGVRAWKDEGASLHCERLHAIFSKGLDWSKRQGLLPPPRKPSTIVSF